MLCQENAELMLYGVSERYKERCVHRPVQERVCANPTVFCSANCRLELNYGMQHEVGESNNTASFCTSSWLTTGCERRYDTFDDAARL